MCVTYADSSPSTIRTVLDTVSEMGARCDWYVLLYKGDTSSWLNAFALMDNVDSLSFQVSKPPLSTSTGFISKWALLASLNKEVFEKYSYVWCMDSDILLRGSDSDRYVEILEKIDGGIPLISQPTIDYDGIKFQGSTKASFWKKEENSKIVYDRVKFWELMEVKAPTEDKLKRLKKIKLSSPALDMKTELLYIETVVIEQQVFLIDARFFFYFLSSIIDPMDNYEHTGFGPDYIWCGAANFYTNELGVKNRLPCVIVPAVPVTTTDTKTISIKFRSQTGSDMTKKYGDFYPNWAMHSLVRKLKEAPLLALNKKLEINNKA